MKKQGTYHLLKKYAGDSLKWLLAAILVVLTIFPFLYIVSTALKSDTELFSSANSLFPQIPKWDNLLESWKLLDFTRCFINSLIVSLSATFGTIAVCSMAAYAFTRFEFRVKNLLFILYLSTIMMPIVVRLIPSYILCKYLNLRDTYPGMFLPLIAWSIPLGTFLLRQFFIGIPRDLDEAAKIDGAGHFRIFLSIILPNAKSSMATLGTYVFISAWNNLIWMLLVVSKQTMWTITLGIGSICGASVLKLPPWNLIMGVIVIGLIPVLLLYFIFQKYFIQSVTATGIK